MNALLKHIAGTVLALATLLPLTPAQAATLTLDPADGALRANSGQAVGWGFSLVNDSDYLVVTSADFLAASGTGSFTDYVGPQFLVLGPAETLSQAFDSGAQTGIGQFLVNSGTTIPTIVSGPIVLTYDLYSVNPNDPGFDPINSLISTGNFLTADASVAVVPLPASALLMLTAIPAFAGFCRRRQSGSGGGAGIN